MRYLNHQTYYTFCIVFCLLTVTVSCDEKSLQTQNEHSAQTVSQTSSTLPTPQADTLNSPAMRFSGTEPFWSLSIDGKEAVFTEMDGDTITFSCQPPVPAQGRQAEYLRLYRLSNKNWLIVRKGSSPCSDGMSDAAFEYTATLWLNNQLWDGCGRLMPN